jgi:hypothetical protein
MRARIRELAAGLMAAAMALPLVSATGAYTLSDNARALGLADAGPTGSNAGLTVAIPVSGGSDEQASKRQPHGHVQRKHTGS